MRALAAMRARVMVALAAALVLGATAGLDAQRRNRGDNSVHGVPVATNTITRAPEQFVGKLVTVSATVDRVVSDRVFVVDQRRVAKGSGVEPAGTPLLVIAPEMAAPVSTDKAFLVRGQVASFEEGMAKAAADGIALPSDFAGRYAGKPVLLATSIIDSKYAELVKSSAP